MSSKTRVYELAKELGLENKAVLDLCAQLGIEGKKSHSNSLSDDEAEKVRRSVIRQAVSGKKVVREIKREGGVLTERRVGNVIRRRKKSGEAEEEEAPTPELELPVVEETSMEPEPVSTKKEALAQADALFADASDKAESEEEDSEPEEVVEESASEVELDAAPVEQAEVIGEEPAEESVVESRAKEPAAPEKAALKGGAKVLGKIDLPKKPEPVKKEVTPKPAESRGGRNGVAPTESQEESGGRFGKKKSLGRKGGDQGRDRKQKRRKVLARGDLLDYEGDRDQWRRKGDKKKKTKNTQQQEAGPTKASKLVIKIDGEITVGELASRMGVKSAEMVKQLMGLGVMAGINQLVDFETASLMAEEYGYKIENTGETEEEFSAKLKGEDSPDDLQLRPPVVTVMGHVDHGKTSLLDVIRQASVADGEAGGITQHIGAYQVKLESGGAVTFLDTPGHAAFTAMRGRGAKVTDIVVLVVAADDGVMPQTIEAINHAKAAEVPIIVAVNKIDKEGAQPDKIKTQISEHGLVPEDWGGDTIMVNVSAHTKEGVPELLENLNLQSEVMELKANPSRKAIGTVIESKLDNKRGALISVLVQNGTLNKGDIFLCGSTWGKVRALIGDDGSNIEVAGPGTPVEILGVSTPPEAGDDFYVMGSESEARSYAEERAHKDRSKALAKRNGGTGGMEALTLENFASKISEGEMRELPLVVKGDVAGSVEAVRESLEKLSNEEVSVRVIHTGVGAVTENDIQLASASKAIVVAFNVRADTRGSVAAEKDGVDVLYSRVIYELVEHIEKALTGMLEPVAKEKTLGRVEVRDTFSVPKMGTVAGSYVLDGVVKRNAMLRLLRDNRVIHEGKIATLRRFKDDVKEVNSGYECGIGIEGYTDIQPGDILEVYQIEMVQPT